MSKTAPPMKHAKKTVKNLQVVSDVVRNLRRLYADFTYELVKLRAKKIAPIVYEAAGDWPKLITF